METIITNSIGMIMMLIQPGNFLMGCNDPPAKWDEVPIHDVKISQPFYISETEVTIEQFRQFKADFGLFDGCFADTHNSITGNYGGMFIPPDAIALNIFGLIDYR